MNDTTVMEYGEMYAVLVLPGFQTPAEIVERFEVIERDLVERYAPRSARLLCIVRDDCPRDELVALVDETIPASARFEP